ncbi:MAG TPA: hypothetical protein VK961_06425 [Chthoniobacter sp.]|nr:hypothetical protein [Chthoniobacter sp.]
MREATSISELRSALRRQGIWGTRAERLLQEWADHVHETAAQQVADGATLEAADQAAWQALGVPRVLAAGAARELVRSSWLGRHPWLAGLCLPLAGWLLVMTIAVFAAVTMAESASRPACTALEITMHWVPWLVGCAWLAWLVRRMPGGWKLYWISAVVLVLLTTSMIWQIKPPTHGPGTLAQGPRLALVTTLGGIPGAILNKLGTLFHLWERIEPANDRTVYFSNPSTVIPWIQIALSTVGMIGVHRWSRSSARPDQWRPA